jgi:Rrf2 family protein
MMFTTKTEYGMRAMTSLAKNKGKTPLSLTQIAKENHISASYLEQIMAKLKANDLVKSSKGTAGGYMLYRPAKNISVFEIVEALEGALSVFYCMSEDSRKMVCSRDKCLTKRVWQELQKNIISTLRKFKLSDLI